MTSDYGRLSFDQQMDVIKAEVNFRKPQIQAAQAMWQDSKYQLDMQAAKFNDKLSAVANAWGPKDPNSTSFENLLLDDMKVMASWTDSIQKNQVGNQLAALSESIDFTMSTMTTMATKHEAGAKAAQQSGKPFDDHDYRQFGAYLLNQLGTEYRKVAAGIDRVQGSEWTGRRVATSDSSGPGNADNPDGNSSSNTGNTPGTDAPGATDTATQQQTPDNKTPAEQQNPLGDTADAMDAASQAAQSLGGLLDGSGASDAASSIGDYNPSDLASMTPEDYAKYLDQLGSTSAGGPTLAGLDTSGVGGVRGGGASSLGGVMGVGDISGGIGSNGAAGSGLTSATTVGAAGNAAGTASGTAPGMSPGMFGPRGGGMGGQGGSSGVRPGAAEEENGFRKRKPAPTPGVSLRGRSGKTKPHQESRAKSSVPAPQRNRQPVDELLHEELWQLNPEENEPRTQAGY